MYINETIRDNMNISEAIEQMKEGYTMQCEGSCPVFMDLTADEPPYFFVCVHGMKDPITGLLMEPQIYPEYRVQCHTDFLSDTWKAVGRGDGEVIMDAYKAEATDRARKYQEQQDEKRMLFAHKR